MSAGKGSRPRPVNFAKFQAEHERIFTKRSDNPHQPGEVIDGAESLGDGGWHLIDQREPELREGE